MLRHCGEQLAPGASGWLIHRVVQQYMRWPALRASLARLLNSNTNEASPQTDEVYRHNMS
jgi:hypothetical protein